GAPGAPGRHGGAPPHRGVRSRRRARDAAVRCARRDARLSGDVRPRRHRDARRRRGDGRRRRDCTSARGRIGRPSMRRVVCLVLAAVVTPARADELADALRTLQQRYESTRTLVAKFRQEVESPTMAGKLTSNGTVSFEKPNRMRWDYAAPDRQTIVSDGETLWIYQPEEKQVLKA